MASSFTLDDIRAAAEAKYGSTEIGDVVLLNPLRLPKAKRDKLMSIQDQMSAEGDEAPDQAEILADAIRLVAQSPTKAERMLEEIGDDLAVLVTIFEKYTSGSQVGEASASDD